MMDAGIAAQFYAKSLGGSPSSAAVSKMTDAQIDQTSQDFEALFIGMMVEHMFGDSMGTEAFGAKESADVYKGMMAEAYGREIAQAGGIGVASYVKTELLRLQEQQN
jgi:peptidoglycan hydrolase FlgJ